MAVLVADDEEDIVAAIPTVSSVLAIPTVAVAAADDDGTESGAASVLTGAPVAVAISDRHRCRAAAARLACAFPCGEADDAVARRMQHERLRGREAGEGYPQQEEQAERGALHGNRSRWTRLKGRRHRHRSPHRHHLPRRRLRRRRRRHRLRRRRRRHLGSCCRR